MTVEEKAFDEKIEQVELEDLMYEEFYDLISEAKRVGKEIGRAEGMRWRDPKVELPENEEIVQVKCHSNNETWYEQLRYMKAHNVWACDQTIGAKVVGWKPIE